MRRRQPRRLRRYPQPADRRWLRRRHEKNASTVTLAAELAYSDATVRRGLPATAVYRDGRAREATRAAGTRRRGSGRPSEDLIRQRGDPL